MISKFHKFYSVLDQTTKRGILVLFVMMIFSTLLEMIGITIFIPLLSLLSNSNNIQEYSMFTDIIGGLSGDKNKLLILLASGLMIFFFLKNLFLGFFSYYQNRFIYQLSARYSVDFLGMYLSRPYDFHLRQNSAELTRNIYDLVSSIFSKTMLPVLQLVLEILTALGILIVMLLVQPIATILVASILSLSAAIFYFIVQNKVRIWQKIITEALEHKIRWINQSLGSVKETILSDHQKYFQDLFAIPTYKVAKYMAFSNTIPSLPRLFIEVIVIGCVLVTILMLLLVRHQPIDSIITTLGLFGFAAMRILPAFGKIVSNLTVIKQNTVIIDILFDDFYSLRNSEKQELVTAQDSALSKEIHFRKELSITDVTFSYPGSELAALVDVNVSIPRGKSIAIVGRSGAGKSTLVDVILGLFRPETGEVKIDGHDIFNNISSWRRLIGYIPQDIYILDDTLKRNIALGVKDEYIDNAKIENAIKLAQLEPVIEQLPENINTIVGENGTRLSGGQRQRIGIARALYNDPEIIVMDEATSALDGETEKEISSAISILTGKKTIIIIAHRLSTIRDCDMLIFMDQGSVRATGSFEELAENEPGFLRMIELAAIQSDKTA
jgi:ATP-binding cassette, subfamily B, bacterial PglK